MGRTLTKRRTAMRKLASKLYAAALLGLTLTALAEPPEPVFHDPAVIRDSEITRSVGARGSTGANLLLYALPDHLNYDDATLTIDVVKNGEVLSSESISLAFGDRLDLSKDAANPPQNPIIDLLTTRPGLKKRLMAAGTGEDVELIVQLDGSFLDSFTLAELLERQDVLRRRIHSLADFTAQERLGVPVSNRALASGFVAKASSCRDMCEQQEEDCEIFRCEADIGSTSRRCLRGCEEEFLECLEFECGICQPSTTTTEDVRLIGEIPTGQLACDFGTPPFQYERIDQVFELTTTTRTKNADCTVTVTTEVRIGFGSCWQFRSSQCLTSRHTAGPFC